MEFQVIKGVQNLVRITKISKEVLENVFTFKSQFVKRSSDHEIIYGLVSDKNSFLGPNCIQINTDHIEDDTLTIESYTDSKTALINHMDDIEEIYAEVLKFAKNIENSLAKIKEV